MKNSVVLFEFSTSICETQLLPRQELTAAVLQSILDAAMVDFNQPTDLLLRGWVVETKIFGIFKSPKPLASVPKGDKGFCSRGPYIFEMSAIPLVILLI